MGICFPLSQVSPLLLEASSQWDEGTRAVPGSSHAGYGTIRTAPRRTCSLGASPFHHQPTGEKLFRDPPEKLSAKLYETDSRKPAQMGAQRASRVVGGGRPPWGVGRFLGRCVEVSAPLGSQEGTPALVGLFLRSRQFPTFAFSSSKRAPTMVSPSGA